MRAALPLALLATAAAGCAPQRSGPGTDLFLVDIPFEARFGSEAFACGEQYDGVGSSSSRIEPRFLKLYVSELELLDGSGDSTELVLLPDGRWQQHQVGLIDLATDAGLCAEYENATTNTVLHGATSPGEYTGLRFRLGIGPDLNHLDAELAQPPLEVPEMWWSWALGYRWLRLELSTPAHETWNFHHGATACEGEPESGYDCAYDNDTLIELPFTPGQSTVVLDLEELLSGSDLEAEPSDPLDSVVGCMSFEHDPECAPLFERLGLVWESNEAGPAQTAFYTEPAP